MISIIGFIALPVLLLSLAFIFFHWKFIGLYNSYKCNKELLNEAKSHKFELLMYYSQDILESKSILEDDLEIDFNIAKLEELLCNFEFTDQDAKELADITGEIETTQNMYCQSKEDYYKFTSKFPGNYLSIFLIGKPI